MVMVACKLNAASTLGMCKRGTQQKVKTISVRWRCGLLEVENWPMYLSEQCNFDHKNGRCFSSARIHKFWENILTFLPRRKILRNNY